MIPANLSFPFLRADNNKALLNEQLQILERAQFRENCLYKAILYICHGMNAEYGCIEVLQWLRESTFHLEKVA